VDGYRQRAYVTEKPAAQAFSDESLTADAEKPHDNLFHVILSCVNSVSSIHVLPLLPSASPLGILYRSMLLQVRTTIAHPHTHGLHLTSPCAENRTFSRLTFSQVVFQLLPPPRLTHWFSAPSRWPAQVSRDLTSHSTLYRSFHERFFPSRWPNQ